MNQIDKLIEIMENEINLLNTLPEDEAKEIAKNNLIAIGVLNQDGTITDPYKDAFIKIGD